MNEIITLVDEHGMPFRMQVKPCELNLSGEVNELLKTLQWHEIRSLKNLNGRVVFVAHHENTGYVIANGKVMEVPDCKDLRDMLTQTFSNN